jgi:hypothetical protein
MGSAMLRSRGHKGEKTISRTGKSFKATSSRTLASTRIDLFQISLAGDFCTIMRCSAAECWPASAGDDGKQPAHQCQNVQPVLTFHAWKVKPLADRLAPSAPS